LGDSSLTETPVVVEIRTMRLDRGDSREVRPPGDGVSADHPVSDS